ncbi:MAG: lipid-A-disaccharide synthase [Bacteroidales bacterium]|nr:lipid-A-disaccharide synthase [Bacteroidales bacterium]
MKYFLIAGEASGDLHAAHLMKALLAIDPSASFRYYGGDCMQAVGGTLLCHYRHLAYMGFVQVALHLPTILRGLRRCKAEIDSWRPDAVILVDYPGFNLKIAKYVSRQALCPVYYYISPKIWAWKEHRIYAIRRYVDRLFSILPFEVDFFEKKHHYPISYVGNPTMDEVSAYLSEHGQPRPDGHTIALLPGSRRQEITDNLSRMLQAVKPLCTEGGGEPAWHIRIAVAPSMPRDLYTAIVQRAGLPARSVQLVEERTYDLLHHATAALVTSGTATLETALFRVPQVVCYFMRCGWLVSRIRPYFLKVPFISLVNLIVGREVVPELVAGDMTAEEVRRRLLHILPGAPGRAAMLQGYDELAGKLGQPGAPRRAAAEITQLLRGKHSSL